MLLPSQAAATFGSQKHVDRPETKTYLSHALPKKTGSLLPSNVAQRTQQEYF